jgi:hypothetical protein
MRIFQTLHSLEEGDVAQLIDGMVQSMIDAFPYDNSYCFYKDGAGNVRWLRGSQKVLSMTNFVMISFWSIRKMNGEIIE